MSFDLRKSTAGQVVQFKMVDSTTGLKKTGLAIANTDIKLIFEAGTTQTSKNSGGATEIGSTGVYYMTLDATDSATLGRLRADIEVAGALPWFENFMVLTALAWDALYAASGGAIMADLQTIKTQAVTAAAGVTFPTSLASPTNITAGIITTVTTLTNLPAAPADWLAAAAVKADAVTKIQTGLATPTNITAGTITTVTNLTNAPTTGDLTAAMKTSVRDAMKLAPTAGSPAVNSIDDLLATLQTTAGSIPNGTAWTDGSLAIILLSMNVGTLAGDIHVGDFTVSDTFTPVVLPTIPAGWLTAAGIAAAALNGKGNWLLASGYTAPPATVQVNATTGWGGSALPTAFTASNYVAAPTAAQNATAILTDLLVGTDFGTVGSFGKLVKDNLDAKVSEAGGGVGLTAQQTADAVNNLAPASTGASGSLRVKVDALAPGSATNVTIEDTRVKIEGGQT